MKRRNFVFRALAVAVLALVLGVACSGGDEPASLTSRDDLNPTDVASTETSGEDPGGTLERPPALTASAGAQSVAVGLGTYCWTSPGGGSALCADVFGIITGLTALPASAGEAVTVHGDLLVARASGVSGWAIPRPAEPIADGDDWLVWGLSPDDRVTLEIALSGDTLTFDADLPPGRYVVALFLDFRQGDASYGLLLDVQ